MNFRVGQKVVCVDASHSNGTLTENAIYTVLGLGYDDLIQVDAFDRGHPEANHWFRRRFRPLVEKKTSIEIFEKILIDAENFKVVENA